MQYSNMALEFTCFCAHAIDNKPEVELDKCDFSGLKQKHEDGIITPIAFYDKNEWEKIAKSKELPVIDPETISYEDFFVDFICKNLPCIFSSKLTADWISRKKWISKEEGNDVINFEYLLSVYADATVSAVNCADPEYKEGYGSSDCRDMLFKDYISYWKELGSCKDADDKAHEHNSMPCLYLKDWHIVRFHQNVDADDNVVSEIPYETPLFFQSDFLNESCTQTHSDDFKFCYMGPKGTYTSFHADVYGSYSWSANVFGVKQWYLYPPGRELRFMDPKTKRLKYNWDDPGTEGIDYLKVIQQPGECIFVPSGWHHVVWNMTDAISINHNWFNGANLSYIWNLLQKALKDVEMELNDLRNISEFDEQCQFLLKAHHGMNYEDFFQLLRLIKLNRQSGNVPGINNEHFQIKYDLCAIEHLIEKHCKLDPIGKQYFNNITMS